MPSFQFDKFSAVYIKSASAVLPGQNHRSSGNYDLNKLLRLSHLMWECPGGISFDVMEDKSAAADQIIFSNIKYGTITSFPLESTCRSLYIANPRYEGKEITQSFEFDIKIIPVSYA